jgi:tetratricopeptide (TPR) repeat protein
MAHANLGLALGSTGDWDGMINEEREALRLNPNNDLAHADLGFALGNKGDMDGKIAEEREALRLNPNLAEAHVGLGSALGNKGDWDGAIIEEREAVRLDPNLDLAHNNLGLALGKKGDWDGAVAEYREALRLNPNDALAHAGLGLVHASKGDWDGEIAEFREIVRLNPKNGGAHFGLGAGLEKKGDRQGALEEYHAAYTLDPKNAQFKQAYERLLQPSSQPAPQGAQRLQDVRRIYVGSFGAEEGAEVIRTKVITRLVKTGRFEVVQSADQADAILTGASYVSRTERYSANGSGGTHYHATAGVQLINKNQNILWADDTSSGGFSRSASSSLADRIVNDLLKAIAKEVKPK